MSKLRVLMVCMGNICRSPMAHGVLEQRLRERGLENVIEVDSAGTHGYHIGSGPDPRARDEARGRGYDISHLRARQLEREDFDEFDYILVMDEANERIARQLQGKDTRARLQRFPEYAVNRPETEVPDPYYGGGEGFVHVMDLVEAAADGLLAHFEREHGIRPRKGSTG
ncbi:MULTISPECIES: low molecular weight protein-tyrosine-phosphatase [Thioalkalivibrio]|uniref:protein-tyrosine-phosphatase n=1 Tax=Thioalkalivibrio halophilus TaxID=252474 RepID=A0A1V3A1X8_9GAMM|nr:MULTISPECIES: low molecular weight protein-tyrosine-phosphatase [Thioalkalivibrio]OOC11370.1 phosphotyrosine protein phosphatase [Thioalkalivibrio halophilus]